MVGKAGRSSVGKGMIIEFKRKLAYRLTCKMPTKYSLKVQAIRSKNQQPRLYVYLPLPLAAAIGLEPGEEVQWELLDRGELHLVRRTPPPPLAKAKVKRQ